MRNLMVRKFKSNNTSTFDRYQCKDYEIMWIDRWKLDYDVLPNLWFEAYGSNSQKYEGRKPLDTIIAWHGPETKEVGNVGYRLSGMVSC